MVRIRKTKTKTKKNKKNKYRKYKEPKNNKIGGGVGDKKNKKTRKKEANSKYQPSPLTNVIGTRQQLTVRPINPPSELNLNEDELHDKIISNCEDTNECLTLGIYGEYVKKYFNNFNDLTMVDENNITTIASGRNGIVSKVPFKKNGLVSYTILKFPLHTNNLGLVDDSPDNLFYEYYVGKYFINNYNTIFPCFLETYNCYTGNIRDVNIHSYFENKKPVTRNSWSLFNWFGVQSKTKETDEPHFSELEPFNDSGENIWMNACKFSENICIISQYFNNLTTIAELISILSPNEIICCLYQVYFPLSLLGTNYTHYDLNYLNVLRYPLDSHIKMYYHIDDENEIIFYTNSLFKIRDYGTNYFNNHAITSREMIQRVCDEPMCNNTLEISKDRLCGDTRGFARIKGSIKGANDNYYITPDKHNVSHDLRFANYIKHERPDVFSLIADEIIFRQEKGTPEILDNTFTPTNRIISNIFDMRNALDLYLITNPHTIQQVTSELHIYSD